MRMLLLSVYIKRIQKVSYCFFSVKNTLKLINQQLKNGVKIVNWQKKVSYCFFFYCKKYTYFSRVKCLPTSNKLLLLLTNFLQNRITLLLVLKLLQKIEEPLSTCVCYWQTIIKIGF